MGSGLLSCGFQLARLQTRPHSLRRSRLAREPPDSFEATLAIAVSRGHKRLDLGVQPLAPLARPRPRGGGWFRPYVGTPFRAPAVACSGKVASASDGVQAAGSRRPSHLRPLAVSPTWQVQGAVWG